MLDKEEEDNTQHKHTSQSVAEQDAAVTLTKMQGSPVVHKFAPRFSSGTSVRQCGLAKVKKLAPIGTSLMSSSTLVFPCCFMLVTNLQL